VKVLVDEKNLMIEEETIPAVVKTGLEIKVCKF